MKYIIANWKANKTLNESMSWVEIFTSKFSRSPKIADKVDKNLISIIICPSSPHIYPLQQKLKNYKNIYVGSQDISNVEKGTYTGEITALNLNGMVSYSIIGHSERRKHYLETDEMLLSKFNLAELNNIKSFFCISSLNNLLPKNVQFICWEPPESISVGDGKGDFKPLSDILSFKKQLNLPQTHFIYGGSVNEVNIKEYITSNEIEGFLVGGASLDPQRFFSLIENASSYLK